MRSYLSGLASWHVDRGLPPPTTSPRLARILAEIHAGEEAAANVEEDIHAGEEAAAHFEEEIHAGEEAAANVEEGIHADEVFDDGGEDNALYAQEENQNAEEAIHDDEDAVVNELHNTDKVAQHLEEETQNAGGEAPKAEETPHHGEEAASNAGDVLHNADEEDRAPREGLQNAGEEAHNAEQVADQLEKGPSPQGETPISSISTAPPNVVPASISTCGGQLSQTMQPQVPKSENAFVRRLDRLIEKQFGPQRPWADLEDSDSDSLKTSPKVEVKASSAQRMRPGDSSTIRPVGLADSAGASSQASTTPNLPASARHLEGPWRKVQPYKPPKKVQAVKRTPSRVAGEQLEWPFGNWKPEKASRRGQRPSIDTTILRALILDDDPIIRRCAPPPTLPGQMIALGGSQQNELPQTNPIPEIQQVEAPIETAVPEIVQPAASQPED
ncbi:hypothetical protein BJ508DRAFT_303579 [Ascobolus immersus RN42]|uniref:Uncharacterized protein n=1 Tax=Ascobolus immersus RN42 TaxID=1160509 RepID=A0A3N4IKW7_ASCIM|nr:hypothetical protein BJ508DRAFT_303579 [Ascobolus immersus RN42]